MDERELQSATESIKVALDALKHLTTLNAGSIVVIGTFLRDIFPPSTRQGALLDKSPSDPSVYVATAFIFFGLSLAIFPVFMISYTTALRRIAQSEDPTHLSKQYVLGGAGWYGASHLPYIFFAYGLVIFVYAVLVDMIW